MSSTISEVDTFGYIPFTTERAGEHLDRVRRKNRETAATDPRRHIIRLPLLIVSADGQLLTRDMRTLAEPSPNACLTVPVAQPNFLAKKAKIGTIASRYFRRDIFPGLNTPVIDGTIVPLGYYKSYTADHGSTLLDITSVPIVIRHNEDHENLRASRDFTRFRGATEWVDPQTFEATLAVQATELAENNLALESLALVHLLNNASRAS